MPESPMPAAKDAAGQGTGALQARVLPALALGALAAACEVAVEGAINYYSGSYIPVAVTAIVMGFWASTAVAAVLVVWGVGRVAALLPGRLRHLDWLRPLVVAAAFYVNAAVVANVIGKNDPLGGVVFLNPAFMVAWSVALGVLAGLVAGRIGRGAWLVFAIAVFATAFSGGLACVAWPKAAALMLVGGPAFVLALGGLALTIAGGRAVRLAVGLAFSAACPVAFLVMGELHGVKGLRPVEERFDGGPGTAARSSGRPNVVLIVIDTARADHMSLCDYRYATTPCLEALARDGFLYTHGASVDSTTLPSHASIFTGKYPREHGARSSKEPGVVTMERCRAHYTPLDKSQTTLATYLKQAGYGTGAVVSNYARVCRQFGFDQGFGYYYDLPRLLLFAPASAGAYKYGLEIVDRVFGRNGQLLRPCTDAGTITRLGEKWIEGNDGGPFFLFINYMEPHYPYSAPPPYDLVNRDGAPYDVRLRLQAWLDLITPYIRRGEGISNELMSAAVRQYDGAIAYADSCIGELVEYLKEHGLYENTLLVVTSDHGEFFGEHGLVHHSLELYEEGVRVPILVKYPLQRNAGGRSSVRVSIVDIFATVLEVAGVPIPNVPAQPLETSTHEVIAQRYESGIKTQRYGERFKRDLTVLYSGDFKCIESSTGRHELYDLANDPAEAHNLYGTETTEAARLQGLISQWRARTPDFVPAVSAQQTEPQRPGRTVEPEFHP